MRTIKLWIQKMLNGEQRFGSFVLARGQAKGRIVTKPEVVFVRRGTVWLSVEPGMTLEGKVVAGDFVLHAGQCVEVSGKGRAVMQALEDASIEVRPVAEPRCCDEPDSIPHTELLKAAAMLR